MLDIFSQVKIYLAAAKLERHQPKAPVRQVWCPDCGTFDVSVNVLMKPCVQPGFYYHLKSCKTICRSTNKK